MGDRREETPAKSLSSSLPLRSHAARSAIDFTAVCISFHLAQRMLPALRRDAIGGVVEMHADKDDNGRKARTACLRVCLEAIRQG